MFNNIGRRLKWWAKFFVIAGIIGSIITGVFVAISVTMSGGLELGVLSFLVYATASSLLASISSIALYALGDVHEMLTLLRPHVETKPPLRETDGGGRSETNNMADTEEDYDCIVEEWVCSECGAKNEEHWQLCINCGSYGQDAQDIHMQD